MFLCFKAVKIIKLYFQIFTVYIYGDLSLISGNEVCLCVCSVFLILWLWRRPRLWVCVRCWSSCSNVYSPWGNRTSSRHPVFCFSRNSWPVRKISPSMLSKKKAVMVLISTSTSTILISLFNSVCLSFSVTFLSWQAAGRRWGSWSGTFIISWFSC